MCCRMLGLLPGSSEIEDVIAYARFSSLRRALKVI